MSPQSSSDGQPTASSAQRFTPSHSGPVALNWYQTLRTLDVGVVVQDPDLRIVYANPKATALLGITTDEITSRTTIDERWDVVSPDGTPIHEDSHPGPRALRTGMPVQGVVLGVRRGDAPDRVWILASAVPERAATGEVERVVISFSDVSIAQRALRAHEATYQSVFRSMSEGLVIHNMDGTIRAANSAAERVLGLSVAQMTGRHPMDARWRLVRPDGSNVGPDYIPSEITTRTGEPSQALIGVHRPTGDLAWLDVHADPLREPGDEDMSGVLATFTDITAERHATLALEASRAQIQRVLDAVPGVVYQYLHPTDGDGHVTFIAGRITEVTGMDEQTVRANPDVLFSILEATELQKLQQAIREAVPAMARFQHEVHFRLPSGDDRWVRIDGVPASTAEGVLYTGVMLDSTAERLMSDALRRRQRREAMGDMAGGIAHNFNNMLAVILPNVQLVRDMVDGEAAAHLLDAERAATSAADLVKRMLALGRAESHEAEAQVDLVPIVREALHICRQTFDRGITILDEITVPHAVVHGSASTMQQVVLNLLLNARDAMQGVAHPVLTVSLSRDTRGQFALMVRDTGTGMSDDTLRRIGEPFFTTKEPGRGTGLGLASAFHSIAEAQGTWRVSSQAGVGTTFHVALPPAERTRTPVPAPPVVAAPSMHGAVLIVDDEPMVRTVLARQMSRAGMRPHTADGANAALAMLRQGIDELRVILLDLSMPGLSGADALPLLREAAPGIPVIALSGHVPDSVSLEGVSAVLQKPTGQRELMEAIRRAAPSLDEHSRAETH